MASIEEVDAFLKNAKELRLHLLCEKDHLEGLDTLVPPDLRELCAGSELEARLEEEVEGAKDSIAALEDEVAEVEAVLSKLPEVEAGVLRMRYLEGKGWKDISSETFFCLGHVSGAVHRRAKEYLRKVI